DEVGVAVRESGAAIEHRAVIERVRGRLRLSRRLAARLLRFELIDFLLQDLQLLIDGLAEHGACSESCSQSQGYGGFLHCVSCWVERCAAWLANSASTLTGWLLLSCMSVG